MTATFWYLLTFTCLALGGTDNKVPEELLEAFENRTRPTTSKIVYIVTEELPQAGLVRTTNRYTAFLTGNRILLTHEVADDGIRQRDPRTGEPPLGVRGACLPRSIIVDRESNQDWSQSPGDVGLGWNATGHRVPLREPRTVGLFASWHTNETPQDLVEEMVNWNARWKMIKRDEMLLVSATKTAANSKNGAIEYNWLLDPTKKHSVLEASTTEHRSDGTTVNWGRTITEYVLCDGHWWPKRSEFIAPQNDAIRIVEFESAEFDRPEHPRRISIDMLGQPIGASVRKYGLKDKYPSQQLYYVGDGRTVTEEEWQATKDNYDLGPLQAYTQMMERPVNQGHYPAWWNESTDTYGLYGVAYSPDLWEAYVRRWITKHRPGLQYKPTDVLDEKQINAAWAILEDCRKQVRPITERQGDTAPATPTSKPAAKPDPRIEAVFAELRKRLDGLLRQAQLAPTSTQPTQKPEPFPGRRPR